MPLAQKQNYTEADYYNLPNDVRSAINKFIANVKNILGNSLVNIILYGSYARGEQHANSDIDICILVTLSDDEIQKIRDDIYDFAYDIELETWKDISPIILNIEHFQYWLGTLPFYDNIQNEGVILL